jgi:hypothetical protein
MAVIEIGMFCASPLCLPRAQNESRATRDYREHRNEKNSHDRNGTCLGCGNRCGRRLGPRAAQRRQTRAAMKRSFEPDMGHAMGQRFIEPDVQMRLIFRAPVFRIVTVKDPVSGARLDVRRREAGARLAADRWGAWSNIETRAANCFAIRDEGNFMSTSFW